MLKVEPFNYAGCWVKIKVLDIIGEDLSFRGTFQEKQMLLNL